MIHRRISVQSLLALGLLALAGVVAVAAPVPPQAGQTTGNHKAPLVRIEALKGDQVVLNSVLVLGGRDGAPPAADFRAGQKYDYIVECHPNLAHRPVPDSVCGKGTLRTGLEGSVVLEEGVLHVTASDSKLESLGAMSSDGLTIELPKVTTQALDQRVPVAPGETVRLKAGEFTLAVTCLSAPAPRTS